MVFYILERSYSDTRLMGQGQMPQHWENEVLLSWIDSEVRLYKFELREPSLGLSTGW
jgi:hypothetical protein